MIDVSHISYNEADLVNILVLSIHWYCQNIDIVNIWWLTEVPGPCVVLAGDLSVLYCTVLYTGSSAWLEVGGRVRWGGGEPDDTTGNYFPSAVSQFAVWCSGGIQREAWKVSRDWWWSVLICGEQAGRLVQSVGSTHPGRTVREWSLSSSHLTHHQHIQHHQHGWQGGQGLQSKAGRAGREIWW